MLHDLRESYRREDGDFSSNALLGLAMIVLIALALSSALIFSSLRFGQVGTFCPSDSYCSDRCGCDFSIPQV
jgi:hypothetical protein